MLHPEVPPLTPMLHQQDQFLTRMLSFKPGFQDNEVYESGVKNEDDEVIMADNEAYGNFGLPNNDDDDDDGDEIVMHTILVNNSSNNLNSRSIF